jgi:anti-sigma-K factor RsiG
MTEEDLLKGAGEEGYGWEDAPDLTSISEEELRVRLKELVEEERAVSRRRSLQDSIDLVRVELVQRSGGALPAEELARVLLDGDRDDSARRSV